MNDRCGGALTICFNYIDNVAIAIVDELDRRERMVVSEVDPTNAGEFIGERPRCDPDGLVGERENAAGTGRRNSLSAGVALVRG